MRLLLFVGDKHVGTIEFEWEHSSSWIVDVASIDWGVQSTYLESVLRETFETNLYDLITIGGQRHDDIRPYYEVWEEAIAAMSREKRLGLRVIVSGSLPELLLREEIY